LAMPVRHRRSPRVKGNPATPFPPGVG
jgi:hypothetical protein